MTTFMSILTIIMVEYLLKIPIIYILLIAIASIIMGIFHSYISIIVDLKRPKLEWKLRICSSKAKYEFNVASDFGISKYNNHSSASNYMQFY